MVETSALPSAVRPAEESNRHTRGLHLNYITPFAEESLQKVYDGILTAVEKVADHLRFNISCKIETSNQFGELQLDTDVHTDNLIFESLKDTGVVYAGISEEQPEMKVLTQEGQYIVTFDPLDGSSVLDANMSVGSIFAIWKKREDHQNTMQGYTGKEIIGAALALYGSRTCVLVYNQLENRVDELTLHRKVDQKHQTWHSCHQGELVWTWQRLGCKFKPDCKIFSPGNTRSVSTNKAYLDAVTYWLKSGFTLRYSGAMAADCYLVLIKGEGIFSSISSPAFGVQPKLRVLFECLPISFLVVKSGGMASTGTMPMMDLQVTDYTQRTDIVIGSHEEVKRLEEFIKCQNEVRTSNLIQPDPQI